MKNFNNLFVHELDDTYSAEKQMGELFQKLADSASAPKLKEAFEKHRLETLQHMRRLEKIAEEQNISLGTHTCRVLNIIAEEAEKIINADYPPEVKDAALISCVQRMEHYEIALYGTLKAFAKHLGLKDVERELNETSKEEGAFDKKLTEIATGSLFVSGINKKAIRKSA